MCAGGGGKPPTPFTPPPKPEPVADLLLDAEGTARASKLRRRGKLRQGRSSLVTPGLSAGLAIGRTPASSGGSTLGISGG